MLFFSNRNVRFGPKYIWKQSEKHNMKKSDTLFMCWCSSKCGWFDGVWIHKYWDRNCVFLHIEGYIIYITICTIYILFIYIYIYIYINISWLGTWFSCFIQLSDGASRCKNAKKKCQLPTKIGPQTRLARTNVTLTVDLRPESSRDRSSAQQTSRDWRVVTRFGGPRDREMQITQISL